MLCCQTLHRNNFTIIPSYSVPFFIILKKPFKKVCNLKMTRACGIIKNVLNIATLRWWLESYYQLKKKNILIFEIYDREINFLTGSVLIKRCQTSSTLAHFQNKIILTTTDSKNRIILGTGMMLNVPLAILSKL